jgi:hypothetical protein
MVDLQLHTDQGAMAFSGKILSLQEVETCVLGHILPNRPAEVWLSSRAHVARLGDIFGDSRAIRIAERCMKEKGKARQRSILRTRQSATTTMIEEDNADNTTTTTDRAPAAAQQRRAVARAPWWLTSLAFLAVIIIVVPFLSVTMMPSGGGAAVAANYTTCEEETPPPSNPTMSDAYVAVFRSIVIHLLAYAALFATVDYAFHSNRKTIVKFVGLKHEFLPINPAPTSSGVLRREHVRVMFSAAVDAVYAWIVSSHGSFSNEPLTFATVVAAALGVTVWTEAHFFFSHRLLHWGPLFRAAHYAHHESHNPGPWSSLSFHPIEAFVFFSAYLLVFVLPPATFPHQVWWAFKAGMVVGPIHAHV